MTDVTCCVCRKTWSAESPGISYRSLDGRWWCTSATSCTRRYARAKSRQAQLLTETIGLLASLFPLEAPRAH